MAASAEAPRRQAAVAAADDYRAWVRALFTDLADQAGAADPAALARQLHMLYDGAAISARMDRDPVAALATGRTTATALLDAVLGANR